MAIQHRRGKKVDFDPQKMLPGEWAVSTDAETENQIIWMCFRPGVVKRMGTYEDFREQILEITDDIREEFSQTINEIKVYMEGLKSDTEGYKNTAEQKATQASISATNAANSADLSEDYAGKAQSYAKGTGGVVRPNDDSDCAEFYYEQVKRISQGVEGIIPMGTITFAELALPYNEIPRYMFDISDEFVTDERFKNGSGIYYGAGSNVIRTADDMWDVLAPTAVYGVKGDKESIYRQGFVNLTPEDIGAATVEDLSGINADFVGTTAELEAKIEAGEITDGMTVYLTDGGGDENELSPNKVLISDQNGNISSSDIGTDKLGMLSNVKSDIQKQIDDLTEKIGEEGGLGGVPLGDCKDITIENKINSLLLNWKEPENIVFDGAITAEWKGTKVLRKEGEYSKNADDGILVINNIVKNAYEENPLIDGDLTDGIEYFYTLFPYTTKNVYTMSDKNRISRVAKSVSPVLKENTWDIIALVSEQGNAKDYWNIGDAKDGYEIMGFDHDDLADGTGKAGITFVCYDSNRMKKGWWCQGKSGTNASTTIVPYVGSTIYNALEKIYDGSDSNALPEEIRKHVKKIKKIYNTRASVSANDSLEETEVYLFIPSSIEATGLGISEGTVYQEFLDLVKNRQYLVKNGDDIDTSECWTRTTSGRIASLANGYYASYYYTITKNGGRSSVYGYAWPNSPHVWDRYGFCI